ncbi:hypothetical protein KDN24_23180 [Bacillus sp. Bva_UNVM-123]|uniref:hypothetical protein n=1 Tax=Bacillus sp. Bva_UNVM-123 TaxID=2829798 RepID=UPI00391F45ED
MTNISEDVFFKIENEQGEGIQALNGQQSHYLNYNRFVALKGGKIKIIPVSYKERNQEYIHTNEIIELDLDEKIREQEGN